MQQYKNNELLLLKPNRAEDIKNDIQRVLNVLDYDTGYTMVDDKTSFGNRKKILNFLLDGEDEIFTFIDFFDRCKGKLVPFWMPTWQRDFYLLQNIQGSELVIKSLGYGRFYSGYRDTVIVILHNGTYFIRKITGYNEMSGREYLVLESEMQGKPIQLDTIACVCFLGLFRLDSDRLEIIYQNKQIATVAISVMELFRG